MLFVAVGTAGWKELGETLWKIKLLQLHLEDIEIW